MSCSSEIELGPVATAAVPAAGPSAAASEDKALSAAPDSALPPVDSPSRSPAAVTPRRSRRRVYAEDLLSRDASGSPTSRKTIPAVLVDPAPASPALARNPSAPARVDLTLVSAVPASAPAPAPAPAPASSPVPAPAQSPDPSAPSPSAASSSAPATAAEPPAQAPTDAAQPPAPVSQAAAKPPSPVAQAATVAPAPPSPVDAQAATGTSQDPASVTMTSPAPATQADASVPAATTVALAVAAVAATILIGVEVADVPSVALKWALLVSLLCSLGAVGLHVSATLRVPPTHPWAKRLARGMDRSAPWLVAAGWLALYVAVVLGAWALTMAKDGSNRSDYGHLVPFSLCVAFSFVVVVPCLVSLLAGRLPFLPP